MHHSTLYKVISESDWMVIREADSFGGCGIDLDDGFIHLSDPTQIRGTVERYFAGRQDLVLLAVQASLLGESLRYEPSRDGILFPHVYGSIPMAAITSVDALPTGADGKHQFPDSV